MNKNKKYAREIKNAISLINPRSFRCEDGLVFAPGRIFKARPIKGKRLSYLFRTCGHDTWLVNGLMTQAVEEAVSEVVGSTYVSRMDSGVPKFNHNRRYVIIVEELGFGYGYRFVPRFNNRDERVKYEQTHRRRHQRRTRQEVRTDEN